MFHRLRDKANRFFFDRSVSDVLATEPMRVDADSSLLLFTQLQHKDLLMGLLDRCGCRIAEDETIYGDRVEED